VWQLDFSEFETAGGGTWQFAPVVDYHAKPCLASPASTTKTAHDAIGAVTAAIAEAERLLGCGLLEELTDPDTGEITPVTIVTDNGPCFRAGAFAAFIEQRPELRGPTLNRPGLSHGLASPRRGSARSWRWGCSEGASAAGGVARAGW